MLRGPTLAFLQSILLCALARLVGIDAPPSRWGVVFFVAFFQISLRFATFQF
jgi:hypothetical protein